MLDRPRRCARDCGCHGRGAVRRDDDSCRSRSFGAADDGAEVARVGHLVETCKQRELGGCKLPPVRVLVRLAPREHALVIAGACCFAELAFRLGLQPRAFDFLQPGLRLHGALRRPELEDLARAAQRLPHRAAAVDLVAGHRGTSWKPSAAKPVGFVVVAGRARLLPLFGELDDLRWSFLFLCQRRQPEDVERSPQELVVAPAVHHREGVRSVEVVLERSLEPFPCIRGRRLGRPAEDLAESLDSRRGRSQCLVREVDRLRPVAGEEEDEDRLPAPLLEHFMQ